VSVIFGSFGEIELSRTTGGEAPYAAFINDADVDPTKDRFSFDFPEGMLLSGDLVEFKATKGELLSFVDRSGWDSNQQYRDGNWYVHVDGAGGVMLYRTFDEAVSGEERGRVRLQAPSAPITLEVRLVNLIDRVLGQVTRFELNTSRDAVDVTALDNSFRQQYSSLITGNGQIDCLFDYERRRCDPTLFGARDRVEVPMYLHQLILRLELGSRFHAKLHLVKPGSKPGGSTEDRNNQVWYDITGVITNVGISVEPTQPLRSTINYITDGEIKLRTKMDSAGILLEGGTRSTDLLGMESYQGNVPVLQEEDLG
jgi:hypothetical protein